MFYIVDVLSGVLEVNMIFVVINDGMINVILEVFNWNEELVISGSEFLFDFFYCSLVLWNIKENLIIMDIVVYLLICLMDVIKVFGNCFFVGIFIMWCLGEIFGMICLMDKLDYVICEIDIKVLNVMVVFFGYVVDLESILFI